MAKKLHLILILTILGIWLVGGSTYFVPLMAQNLHLNEASNANYQQLIDEDGKEENDWIELYNSGITPINLSDFYLTDSPNEPDKWALPNQTLEAGNYLTVFASGNSLKPEPDTTSGLWRTAIYATDNWQWLFNNQAPPTNWTATDFDDLTWNAGPGGFGYGDADDATLIEPNPTTNPSGVVYGIYIRKKFTVSNPAIIAKALLHIDFDDAFAAYLNGIEIARWGLVGTPPAFDEACPDHEASGYQGLPIDAFSIDLPTLEAALKIGENVLSVEVHNSSPTFSSDLSLAPWLSFYITDGSTPYGQVPNWFYDPNDPNQNDPKWLHTNFKISSAGETVYLFDSDLNLVDSLLVPSLQVGHSIGRQPDGGVGICLFTQPTPQQTNNDAICFVGYLPPPTYSLPAGYYEKTQVLKLSTPSPSAVIRYTTDGSYPVQTSTIYANPIPIDATQVIRACSYSTDPNMLPSEAVANTYFITDSSTVPVIAVSINPNDLFDVNNGIYAYGPNADISSFPFYGANFWDKNTWRDAHIEYFNADGNREFNLSGQLRIQGNWARGFPQKGLTFRKYDWTSSPAIEYALFPDKPHIETFDNFNMRTGSIDWNTVHARDDIMQTGVKDLAIETMATNTCLVYLNGQYWGVYHLREKQDDQYLANNTGVNPDSVDLIRYDYEVMEGSEQGFLQLYNFISNNNMADPEMFAQAGQMADLENWADYFISETYYANIDWLGWYVNNIKIWRPQTPNGRWRYILWDTDLGMGCPSGGWYGYDMLGLAIFQAANRHSEMMLRLLQNPMYANYFTNRYADLMNTVFQPDNFNKKAIEKITNQMRPEMERHFKKWNYPGYEPWDGYGWGASVDTTSWNSAINVMYDFTQYRLEYARNYVQNNMQLFNQVEIVVDAYPAGAGKIKINTITPALPFAGVYFDGAPITVTAIPNPGYTFVNWGVNNFIDDPLSNSFTANITENTNFQAYFAGEAEYPAPLTISEINYHPDETHPSGDWLELHNYGDNPLYLADWVIQGEKAWEKNILPTQMVLPPNGRAVICQNPNAFAAQYPEVTNVWGPLNFSLNNKEQRLLVLSNNADTVVNLTYTDAAPWPCTPDGWGRTLELTQPDANPALPQNWFDGCVGGSPGKAYAPCNELPVVSELHYNPALAANCSDWIELFNASFVDTLNLTNWKLRDENDNLYVFPDNITLAPQTFLVLAQDTTAFNAIYKVANLPITTLLGPLKFGFSGSGEILRLFDASGILQSSLCYDDAAPFPTEPDGKGYTLQIKKAKNNPNDGKNWIAGCYGGTPGSQYDADCCTAPSDCLKTFK